MTNSSDSTINLIVIAGIRGHFRTTAAFQQEVSQWNKIASPKFKVFYVNTGQHYDYELAGALIDELGVKFDVSYTYDDHKPINILGEMIKKLDETFEKLEGSLPIDWVIVFGDATTTMAGAIVAVRRGHSVVHAEAGLRSGNIKEVEEMCRVIADHLATVHFASSKLDIHNLAAEGLTEHVIWTGDIAYDLIKRCEPTLAAGYGSYSVGEYVLATIHRAENLSSELTMRNVMQALGNCSRQVIFVAHPRTYRRLEELGLLNFDNIEFSQPLSYLQMLSVIKGCVFIVTDAGGLQREGYYLGKRCLVRQDEPFWPILISEGVNRLIAPTAASIQQGFEWIENVLKSDDFPVIDDLGDGTAVETMLRNIAKLTPHK